MKNLRKFQWLFLFALIAGLSACGDDDEGPKEQFKVDGESFALKRAYIVSAETENEEGDELFVHQVILAGGDLEITNGPEIEGEGDVIQLTILSESDELEAGEYNINNTYLPDDAEEAGYVMVYTKFSVDDGTQDFDDMYAAVDGKIVITRSGDTYTVKITATETIDEDEEELDENLTAYYKGKLEEIEIDEDDGRLPSKQVNPLFSKFVH